MSDAVNFKFSVEPEEMVSHPVALGCSQSAPNMRSAIKQTCILCQEEHDVTHNDRAMVLAAFVQK